MLKPIKNKHTNITLGKPQNWDESQGECIGLPVHSNGEGFYSWWSLNWLERLKVLLGFPVRLCILSNRHPVISVELGEYGDRKPHQPTQRKNDEH